jgi:probable phosphoglycerate mutase
MAAEILFIRHAEADSGVARTSDPLIPLTPRGERQAKSLATTLPEPSLLIVSPYRRARETAKPIQAHFPHVPIVEWPVYELSYLSATACVGLSWERRSVLREQYWTALDPGMVQDETCESFSNFIDRVHLACEQLCQLAAFERRIAVVSHGHFIQACRLISRYPSQSHVAYMRLLFNANLSSPIPNCGVKKATVAPSGALQFEGQWQCHQ